MTPDRGNATKKVLVLRHAKSSWKEAGMGDHDRPLNKRGKRDAPRMGHLLAAEGLVPDLVIGSTAVRARATLTAALDAAGANCEVLFTPEMYLAAPARMVDLLREVPERHALVMLVGHNPGMEALVRGLTGTPVVMPTAALAYVDCVAPGWNGVELSGRGKLLRLWKPRELPAK